jgi:hypothetical protein
MKKRFASMLLATMAATALAGCSSIIEGRSQEIVINTNPPGATCALVRNDMPIGTVAPTPSAILIEKTKYDIVIKCDKDGYQQTTYFNKSGAAGAIFGNIVLGGGIGWAIDPATGSDNKYDSPVNITMLPEENTLASAPSHHHPVQTEAKVDSPAPAADNLNLPASAAQSQTQADAKQSDFPTNKNGSH